ncbi:homoserine kinase [Pseudoalteromonas sp. McH1-7]|nr:MULTISPECIES: homoserine kinase [Pseudoalteromonas]MDW7547593.1 homoserine kinase [Pseudoalteromonas peptidolytica]NLR13435.1 homoserine kinase [Pseudoalteromonas peptidolytica]NUZ09725.1 homoserine kinase [Pseudoalteromonas sp. McH1-7]
MKTFYAPASMGNFCVGFDALGAALEPIDGSLLGDQVSVEAAEYDTFNCIGPYAEKLSADPKDNLAFQCLLHFKQHVAPNMPAVAMTLYKGLPVGSGLGSSACSVVAAFAALNDFADTQLSQEALIELMADFEAKVSGGRHYDNITPCYLGGLQLTADCIPSKAISVAYDENWFYVIAYPGFALNTAKARQALPQQFSLHDTVEFAQRLSGFCLLMQSGQFDNALSMMKDSIAEEARAPLIAGFSEAKKALPALGAELVSISGAGPTLFAICKSEQQANAVQQWLQQHYINDAGFSHICRLDTQGTRELKDQK